VASAIRTEALTKHYGSVVALDQLSLEVSEGEVFGFLGPNGAGKTTTIRLLLDMLRATRGDAWVAGFHCHREGVEARRHIGYLPGELPIYPELTGWGFLKYLAAVGQRPVASATLDRLLGRFDLREVDLRRPMREYSHGMKRKLGLVQALAPDPPVVILDEPTNGLDPLMIDAFAETLHELKTQRRTTVFLSSHVLSEVETTCDRVGMVRRGRLAALESVEDIRARMPRRVTVTFAAPVSDGVPVVANVQVLSRSDRTWVVDVHGPLGPFITALGGLAVDDLRVEPFSLEDYVLRFYTGNA